MTYVIRNFGYTALKDGVAIDTENGFFLITDPFMSRLVQKLSDQQTLSAADLDDKVAMLSKADAEDVREYLTDVTGLLSQSTLPLAQIVWHIEDPQVRMLCDTLYGQNDPVHAGAPVSVHIGVFLTDDFPDQVESQLSRFLEHQQGAQDNTERRIICVFRSSTDIIITPPYEPESGHPCPLCHFDFAWERVAFARGDTLMGLSDVAAQLKAGGAAQMPFIHLPKDTLATALCHAHRVAQRVGASGARLTGPVQAHSGLSITILTLDARPILVPLSPQCDCLRTPHGTGED